MGSPISFEKLFNVRDLGGMVTRGGRVIRTGALLRGDQLFPASDDDLRKLHDIGVRTVIDFRSVGEREELPDPPMPDVENVFLPIIKDVGVGITRGSEGNMRIVELLQSGTSITPAFIEGFMRMMYRVFVEDPFANAQYARFLDEVSRTAESGKATYWHCTAGKDRAGFATAILLAALDVPRADIVADYLQTNDNLEGVTGQSMSLFGQNLPSEELREALERFFAADESYIASAFDAIEQTCGSFDSFLADRLNVDDAKRQRLCDVLLENRG